MIIFTIPPCMKLMYRIRLHYCTVSWLGLLIYICMFFFFKERWRCCVTVRLYNYREKWFGHDTITFYPFISSIWKWHDFSMYSIYVIEGKRRQLIKPPNIIWYLKRNNCVLNTLLSCFYYFKGDSHVMNPFITLFYSHFLWTFI